ncbi:hypothetical protein VdG1_08082 [Verticillium dahliae VDG1]|nr:hypothetical protein VdG1_08082 [Verticillium dahliae VDG1]
MPDVGSIVWIIGSALFAVLLASAMGLFNRKNHMPVEGKTILLTGASEGMGRSVAIKLAARGANIIAVALRGLADALSQELHLYPDNPVAVHVVFPGTITSPGFDRENLTKPDITRQLEDMDPVQTPDQCADAAIRGLERGHFFVTVAWLGFLMRVSMLGGSIRNSWLVDTLTAMFVTPIVWLFVLPDMMAKAKRYGRTHGHPSTYAKVAP